jgi:hypothetical protein
MRPHPAFDALRSEVQRIEARKLRPASVLPVGFRHLGARISELGDQAWAGAALLGIPGFMLWDITRIKTPITMDI